MSKLPPDHATKRAEALRANLLKRKVQNRTRDEKTLKTDNTADNVPQELAQAESKNAVLREPDRSVVDPREDRKHRKAHFADPLQTTSL